MANRHQKPANRTGTAGSGFHHLQEKTVRAFPQGISKQLLLPYRCMTGSKAIAEDKCCRETNHLPFP